jgi:hypothetical protein
MTEDQIERAARALCRMRGQDPDKRVGHNVTVEMDDGTQDSIRCYLPRWNVAAEEVRAALRLQQAIKEACEPEEKPGLKVSTEPPQNLQEAIDAHAEKRLQRTHPSFVGDMAAGSELKHAEDLLNEAIAYLCAKGSVSDASFKAGMAHGLLVGQIRRFLDRDGTA